MGRKVENKKKISTVEQEKCFSCDVTGTYISGYDYNTLGRCDFCDELFCVRCSRKHDCGRVKFPKHFH